MTAETHQRRETSLFLGMGIVVAIVAAVFFSMTMAWRQAAQRQTRWRELHQQVMMARRQAQEAMSPSAREQITAQAAVITRRFMTVERVSDVRSRVAALAEQSGAALTWLPTTTPVRPASPIPGFEECYDILSLVGTVEGSYPGIAQFLSRVNAMDDPAVGVRSLVMTPSPVGMAGGPALKARLVLETYLWRPGASPKGVAAAPAVPEPPQAAEDVTATWSRNPFDPRVAPAEPAA